MADNKNSGELAKATTAAAVAFGKALPLAGPVGAAVAGALAFVPYVVGRAIPGYVQRKERQAEQWWELVLMENCTDIGAAAQISARSEEPEVQEVIVAAFKLILGSVFPTVIPALAMLTREYARQGKARDDFFRGVGEVLTDLSGKEYSDFRALTAWVLESGHMGFVEILQAGASQVPGHPSHEHLAIMGSGVNGPPAFATEPGFPVVTMRRLFHLLKKSGLASEGASGYYGSVSGPHVLNCDRATVAHLATLLIAGQN